jgi:hypothetical protein
VGITGPKRGIWISASQTMRFPDRITDTALEEVKNVSNPSRASFAITPFMHNRRGFSSIYTYGGGQFLLALYRMQLRMVK